jgi:hypothetical protein
MQKHICHKHIVYMYEPNDPYFTLDRVKAKRNRGNNGIALKLSIPSPFTDFPMHFYTRLEVNVVYSGLRLRCFAPL